MSIYFIRKYKFFESYKMMKRLLAPALLLALAACETTTTAPPPVVTQTMSAAQFDGALAAAKRDADPYSGEAKLSSLVNNTALAPDQRARALYARGTQRWKKSGNLRGAAADMAEYTTKYPSQPFARNASVERGYIQRDIGIRERNLQQLQTISQWFEDTWALGDRDKAAARYKKSGLTPTARQIYALERTRYICNGSGAKKVHNYGPVTSEVNNKFWCR